MKKYLIWAVVAYAVYYFFLRKKTVVNDITGETEEVNTELGDSLEKFWDKIGFGGTGSGSGSGSGSGETSAPNTGFKQIIDHAAPMPDFGEGNEVTNDSSALFNFINTNPGTKATPYAISLK